MKKPLIYLSLCILLGLTSTQAQEIKAISSTIDSLESLLKEKPRDEEKIKIWQELVLAYTDVDYDEVIAYAQKMMAYGQKNKNDTLVINAYQSQGQAYLSLGEPQKAQENLEQSLALSQKIDNPKEVAYSLAYLANLSLRTGDLAQGRERYQKALAISQKLADRDIQAQMERGVAATYFIEGDFKKAAEGFVKVLKINRERKDYPQMRDNTYNLGVSYFKIGQHDKARSYYQESLEIARDLGDHFHVGNVYTVMAQTDQHQGNYAQALENYQKALKIFQDLNNQVYLGAVYTNLVEFYDLLKDYEQKLVYAQKALPLLEKTQQKEGLANLYLYIATTYLEQKEDYEQALEYFQKAKKLGQEVGSKYHLAGANAGLGRVFYFNQQYDKALDFTNRSIALSKENEIKSTLITAYLNQARIYLARNQINQARDAGRNAFTLSEETREKEGIAASAEILAQVYQQQKNYERAFHYHKIFKTNSDSLLNEEKIKKITTLENQYQFDQEKARARLAREKKEARLNANIQQQKTLRNAFIGGFVLVLLLAFFMLRSYLIKRKANQKLEEKNELLAEKNELISLQAEELKITNENLAEMDRFKQEITSMLVHDLKSPLSNIIGLTDSGYDPQHQQLVHQSGKNMLKLVNNMLDVQKLEESEINPDLKTVALDSLVQRAYNEVGYLYQVKNIQFQSHLPEGLALELDEELIKRVLVNLLDNAAKYTPNNGQVNLRHEQEPENESPFIKFSIQDTGMGIPPEDLETVFDKYAQVMPRSLGSANSTGLGLTFCKLAVEAQGGEIGVESKEGVGTTFWFTLPIKDLSLAQVSSNAVPAKTFGGGASLALSPEEIKQLSPLVEKISQYEVYEIGQINSLLEEIEGEEKANIAQWKKALEESVYASNASQFQHLLNLVLEKPDKHQA